MPSPNSSHQKKALLKARQLGAQAKAKAEVKTEDADEPPIKKVKTTPNEEEGEVAETDPYLAAAVMPLNDDEIYATEESEES